MNLLTVSNLYPRPDAPQRGMFNARLFTAIHEQGGERAPDVRVSNLCLVPCRRTAQRRRVLEWRVPFEGGPPTRYVPVRHVPVLGRDWSGTACAAALERWAGDQAGADAVLAAWLYPDGAGAAAWAASQGTPCWIMVQGSDTFHLAHALRRRHILRAAGTCAGIICVCRALAERVVAAGVPADKCHVVPNGIDTEVFTYRERCQAAQELTRLGHGDTVGPDAEERVLFVGNLVHVKGPDILLNAWAALRRVKGRGNGPARRLWILGDGPRRSRLERQARRLGLRETVHFVGSRPHRDVALWMNAADALCLTSRSEGMPNVVREALASGLPVVAADVGACREMVEGEPQACVVPHGDGMPVRLADALAGLMQPPPDRAALAARHQTYTWQDQAQRILALIRKGLDKLSLKRTTQT